MALLSQMNKINKNAINLDSFGLKNQEKKIKETYLPDSVM